MSIEIQLTIAIPTYNGVKNLKKQFQRIFKECDKKKYQE